MAQPVRHLVTWTRIRRSNSNVVVAGRGEAYRHAYSEQQAMWLVAQAKKKLFGDNIYFDDFQAHASVT